MARLLALLLTSLLAANENQSLNDPVLLALLETKKAYREKRWDDAERALRTMLELAAAPGREAAVPKILPVYHFYAAATAWEKKDEARARQELARYFEFLPDSAIDPGAYPKSFCIFFDAQRTEFEKRSPAPPPGGPGLAGFAQAAPDPAAVPLYSGDPEWAASAVSFLLTEPEKKEFANLPDEGARREWVFRFWKTLDPDPATDENEFQLEFYRRVQYADAHFSTETLRGSLSDRGRLLVIMGPPTYIGRSALLRSQDPINQLRTTEIQEVRDYRGAVGLRRVPSNRGAMTPGDAEGDVEVWYYKRDRIPRGVPFQELQFTFITKEGYGTGVFQKDARELLALQRAAQLLRRHL